MEGRAELSGSLRRGMQPLSQALYNKEVDGKDDAIDVWQYGQVET